MQQSHANEEIDSNAMVPSTPVVRAYTRFTIETTLLVVLFALVWTASHHDTLSRLDVLGLGVLSSSARESVWNPLFIYTGIATTLMAMIFYGTSFEITPLKLLLPFLPIKHVLKNGQALISPKRAGEVSIPSDESPTQDSLSGSAEGSLSAAVSVGAVTVQLVQQKKGRKSSEGIDDILRAGAGNAELLAEKMQNRINLHLAFGVLIAGLGLGVWYVTFYHTGQAKVDSTISGRAFDALPRITILFFIELLAGFFLRQYRIGVEDLKYFLELQRRADAKRMAYAIFAELKEEKSLKEFATILLNERSDFRLGKDESTTSMLALEKEKNEFIAGLEGVAKHAGDFASKMKRKTD